jgi:hypothetical protein
MATSNVSEIQKAGLILLAAKRWFNVKLNTRSALDKRGLVDWAGNLTPAGIAVFDGQTFRVFYAAFVNGKRIERTWTAGVTITQAIAEIADLKDLGPDDKDAVDFYGITAL